MTKLLDEAISKVRDLPDSEQDAAADALLSVVYKAAPDFRLTDEQVEIVRRTRVDVRAGAIATDPEMAALWKKHGL